MHILHILQQELMLQQHQDLLKLKSKINKINTCAIDFLKIWKSALIELSNTNGGIKINSNKCGSIFLHIFAFSVIELK